jgi:hypothetical protein
MAKVILGSRSFNMLTWDLSDIAGGTVTTDSASEVDVAGASGKFAYTITGSGFTTFDTHGFPTDGTVTGLTMDVPVANGVAGYQAGQDLVIELNSSSLTLTASNFTT